MQTEELRESFPVAKKPVKNNENTGKKYFIIIYNYFTGKLREFYFTKGTHD